ncbi:hypothetical protein ATE92_1102 [Ulvibacter sp. MAR_2010_11]|uniref:hypothetical protein n=1 Tax=Ulvibacter sp. MAR_2010_11 TaxID=1250229 RepID=UPI000C2B6D25|nr:hypothetical protein [Ulvibacter sp. MAR_2010_11]PKA82959.1 hypothetical protein ATE92_1102 [Ulvibacter sp. MAR_2010_11]
MRQQERILTFLILYIVCFSCKKDDTQTCISCSSPQTATFEVCDDGNGNATVNGENTGTSFEVYVAGLEAAGANCGGG